MDSQDKFSEIGNEYRSKLSNIFRKYDIPARPAEEPKVEEQAVITQPIPEETLKLVTVERWTVYSFTLPVKTTKKLAFGFDNKEDALAYIEKHLVKRDDNGEVIPKVLEDQDGNKYHVRYDAIRESVEQVNVYHNDPEITTVGNNHEDVLKAWIG